MSMAKMSGNVFGQAAANRKAEQESIEQTIKSSETSAGRGRPSKENPEKNVTVSIRTSEAKKKQLKMYAVEHGVTISDLLDEFIDSLETKVR